jgi:hypothetical protein
MKIEITCRRTRANLQTHYEVIGTLDYDHIKFLPFDGERINIASPQGAVDHYVVTQVLHHYTWETPERLLAVQSVEIRVVPTD